MDNVENYKVDDLVVFETITNKGEKKRFAGTIVSLLMGNNAIFEQEDSAEIPFCVSGTILYKV